MTELETLEDLIRAGEKVLSTKSSGNGFSFVDAGLYAGWRSQVLTNLPRIIGESHGYLKAIESVSKSAKPSSTKEILGILASIVEDINKERLDTRTFASTPSDLMTQLLEKFHEVARQLRRRHGERDTLHVADEYDVQDLLAALLRIYFDDVRDEEYTPSYAGGSSRMDFLLKNEEIVIEVKMTRPTMSAKTLGDELIIDSQRYISHPNCKELICFVYDPMGHLPNPRGLERDLSAQTPIPIKVFIRP